MRTSLKRQLAEISFRIEPDVIAIIWRRAGVVLAREAATGDWIPAFGTFDGEMFPLDGSDTRDAAAKVLANAGAKVGFKIGRRLDRVKFNRFVEAIGAYAERQLM